VVERLGQAACDHTDLAGDQKYCERAEHEDEGPRHERGSGERHGDGQHACTDDEPSDDSPGDERRVDLPPSQRAREHVVDVLVAARFEQARRSVDESDRQDRLREEARHDVLPVRDAVDGRDPVPQCRAEHDDEQDRGKHRTRNGIRPDVEESQHLAFGQPEERSTFSFVRLVVRREVLYVGIAHEAASAVITLS